MLPRLTYEGLRHLTLMLVDDRRWTDARAGVRYPKTKNYYVVDALNDYFRKFGLEEFCVLEDEAAPPRVRRFVVPAD